MNIDELKKKRVALSARTEKTLSDMETIYNESKRVADVAHNSKKILDNLEREFELQTGLNAIDISFLFFATALQVLQTISSY